MVSGKYFLQIYKLDNQIPLLIVKSLELKEEKMPAVILVHGLGSSKERNLAFAMKLANNGFYVIMPDVRKHGDRGTPTFQKELMKDPVGTLFEVIVKTVDDISRIIDHICEDLKEVDCDKIGMTGISLGGMITFATGLKEERIKVLVPIIASGDLLTVALESSLIKDIYQGVESRQEIKIPDNIKGMLSFIDPVINPSKYFPRPLLMINGEEDTVFPIKAVQKTINALEHAYTSKPELFKYKIYPKVGHEVTPEMIQLAIDFFKEHLK